MNENRKLHVIMLRTAAVLLILVMLSTSMVAGRYARYTTTASGSDSARVARFLVTQAGQLYENVNVEIVPGQKIPIEIQVANDSEVAVKYTISAENLYHNLPLEFSLLNDNALLDALTLAPGDAKTLAFQIYWQADKADDKYIGMVDQIHLTIHVTQID